MRLSSFTTDNNARIVSFIRLNSHELSPVIQHHLKQVYIILFCAILACACGAYLHMLFNFGGALTSSGFIASMIWLKFFTPSQGSSKRVWIFFLAAFLKGVSEGPLINLAFYIDPSTLISALCGVALVLGGFLGSSMFARRKDYLYIGGLVSSGLIMLMIVFFGGSFLKLEMKLCIGILILDGYIMVESHKIIEKAHSGDMDYVKHSFDFFIAVFGQALMMMLRITLSKEEQRRRRRRTREEDNDSDTN